MLIFVLEVHTPAFSKSSVITKLSNEAPVIGNVCDSTLHWMAIMTNHKHFQ
jgi:hypothetical protein